MTPLHLPGECQISHVGGPLLAADSLRGGLVAGDGMLSFKTSQIRRFPRPLTALIPTKPFSFFPGVWGWVSSRSGIRGRVVLNNSASPGGGGGGV